MNVPQAWWDEFWFIDALRAASADVEAWSMLSSEEAEAVLFDLATTLGDLIFASHRRQPDIDLVFELLIALLTRTLPEAGHRADGNAGMLLFFDGLVGPPGRFVPSSDLIDKLEQFLIRLPQVDPRLTESAKLGLDRVAQARNPK